MKYEIDSDTAENIARNILCEQIKTTKKAIKHAKSLLASMKIAKKKDRIPDRYYVELADNETLLNALKIVYDYFGGYTK
jgi:hypothetical protein